MVREMTVEEIEIALKIINYGAIISACVFLTGLFLAFKARKILRKGKREREELDLKYGFDTRGVLELQEENRRLERDGFKGLVFGMIGWIGIIFGGLGTAVFIYIKYVMGW